MSTDPTLDALQQRIAVLEAELVRFRPIAAAAQEAYAFFIGRRPGFAASYGRDVLVAAFEPSRPRRTTKRSPVRRRRSS